MDIVGRLGAEQFIVCFKNIEEVIAIESIERINLALSEAVVKSPSNGSITIESSVSMYSPFWDLSDIDNVLQDIRNALRKVDNVNIN